MPFPRVLVVRLGAMGDIVHALPAVASLKRSLPSARIAWVIDPKWAPLVAENPYLDEVICFDRRKWASVGALWSKLRRERFDVALDLQGLIKSAVIAAVSGARQRIGYARGQAREPAAAWFYSRSIRTHAAHVVDQYLELAAAAGAGGFQPEFPIPRGKPEGELPPGQFVLACPLAGWTSKQWPLEYYAGIARELREDGRTLVLNGAPNARAMLGEVPGAWVHVSGIEGLIDATRRAAGVIGVDSGPLHLAAAIGRPGVAIFGPTDPARNGPYGGTFAVLRDPAAITTYKRDSVIAPSMRAVLPAAVIQALRVRMASHDERKQA